MRWTGSRSRRRIEWEAWEHSKAWAIDLNEQLARRGYTYDPATVEFVAFGANWVGCGVHPPYYATVALARENLPLAEFRAALLAGKVSEKR